MNLLDVMEELHHAQVWDNAYFLKMYDINFALAQGDNNSLEFLMLDLEDIKVEQSKCRSPRLSVEEYKSLTDADLFHICLNGYATELKLATRNLVI